MSESQYQPRHCAFHPKELIFNFCKNSECLLPLCPSCVKVHSEEHKTQKTYGQFENIHKVVNDLDTFFADTVKELNCYTEEIKQHVQERGKEQQELKKRIYEARVKMVTLVQRFFNDFEKEVSKSVIAYNDSMKESYGKVEESISKMKSELEAKTVCLGNQKVLKTIIGFHAKNQQTMIRNEVDAIKNRIEELGEQRVAVVCHPNATQNVIDQLGNYIHLSFQNWQNEIKYPSQFVKTGFSSNSTGNSFHGSVKA